MRSPVGAGSPAKIVNGNAGRLTLRGALKFFAGKSNRRTAAATLIGLLLSSSAHAFDLEQLSDQLAKPSVIHGHFTQEKHLRALPQPLVSKGTFVLAKDHGLLWLLKTPLQQDYRISAQGIARRDASGWQLLPNKSAGAEQNRLFLAVLQGDSSGLQRDFELKLQGEAKQWKLTLVPRSLLLKQVFTQINIDGGDLVQNIELLETQGDSTVLRMQDSTATQPLSDAEQHDFAQ
ncbi:outer membrane lipoprotein carrier protein LolA [Pseudomonas lurida]|uniref:outer membrane lipoprotein carrier protein LolA n=1 Tax=Pseudomonas lurida TaxID=244566 RepID=UPI001644B20A|nr:outer membrane lipoprotein carrier protein LolA [Pseudomonas lurida]MBC3242015.1 outer membrane lipoprotein carrier protein LolA [Pseudomonas lurida]